MSTKRRPNYTSSEIEGLVGAYQELREKRGTYRGGLTVLVKLADLDAAIKQLPLRSRRVVLLHGLLGLTTRTAGEVLQKSHTWVAKEYRIALEEIEWIINGRLD